MGRVLGQCHALLAAAQGLLGRFALGDIQGDAAQVATTRLVPKGDIERLPLAPPPVGGRHGVIDLQGSVLRQRLPVVGLKPGGQVRRPELDVGLAQAVIQAHTEAALE